MYSRLIGYIKRNVKCFFYIVNEIFLLLRPGINERNVAGILLKMIRSIVPTICGLFLIAFGSIVLQHTGNVLTFATDFETKIYLIPITIIAAGCMIILISVSGCLGAKYNNVATLNFYAFLMYVMFIGHWILMQYMVYERDIFVNLAADFVDEAWGSKDDSMDTIDALQVEQHFLTIIAENLQRLFATAIENWQRLLTITTENWQRLLTISAENWQRLLNISIGNLQFAIAIENWQRLLATAIENWQRLLATAIENWQRLLTISAENWQRLLTITAVNLQRLLTFNCCGVTGYEDYKELNRSTPFTCCRLNVFICAMEVLSDVAGCREAFTDYWAANTDIILFSGISIAYVQFACILIGSLMFFLMA
uniref:Tetraspanin n=1 Tax=Glossina brevipalpis TaxID=37001 RepID=A0A1A9WI30_9MUSC